MRSVIVFDDRRERFMYFIDWGLGVMEFGVGVIVGLIANTAETCQHLLGALRFFWLNANLKSLVVFQTGA